MKTLVGKAKQVMRIAYIILAHKNHEQVIRLIGRLDSPGTSFFIHISKGHDECFREVYEAFQDHLHSFLLKRETVKRGGFGLVSATLNGIHEICRRKIDFDFAILLSGQDYPLKSNCEVKQELEKYSGKQLMEYFELPSEEWSYGGLDRIRRYHFWLRNRRITYPPYNKNGVKATASHLLSPFLEEREIPFGFKHYGGSFWWCLSRNCIEYIDDFVRSPSGERLTEFYQHTKFPDEMFFQTIIMNSPLRGTVVNNNMRFIDWSENLPRPALLTKEDFGRLRSSNMLFARKFDIDIDSEILDWIDEDIDRRSSCWTPSSPVSSVVRSL